MDALKRLVQLLRVAQQQQALGTARRGQGVGQGHLAGFVDAEHVDQAFRFVARPEPGRAADHVKRSRRERRAGVADIQEGLRVGEFGFAGSEAGPLTDRDVDSPLPSDPRGLFQELADDLVAVGRDAHLLPCYNQVHDHFRAHRAFAGAGRSLDGQVALVERLDQPPGRILRIFDIRRQRCFAGLTNPRWLAHQQIARRW